jgi:hypothetical protein
MMEGKGESAMTRIVLQSRTGPDGTLHLDVPLGREQADREVQVVIEPLPKRMTQAEYSAWVQSMAGTWQGDFERPPQGEYEQREPLG